MWTITELIDTQKHLVCGHFIWPAAQINCDRAFGSFSLMSRDSRTRVWSCRRNTRSRWNTANSILRLSTDAVSFNGCSNGEKRDFWPTNQLARCAGPRDALAEIWEAPTQPTFTHKPFLCAGSQQRSCASSEKMTQYDYFHKHLSRRITWWNEINTTSDWGPPGSRCWSRIRSELLPGLCMLM